MFEPEGWTGRVDERLGPLPEGWAAWRSLLTDPGKEEKLANLFGNLRGMDTLGAGLARSYFKASKDIGEGLVKDGVAADAEAVNGVLVSGFYHLYGPINDYVG